MSKQSEAKAAQGYDPKPNLPFCVNCKFFTIQTEEKPGFGNETWVKEVGISCTLGGFAVKKQGTCNRHQFKLQ